MQAMQPTAPGPIPNVPRSETVRVRLCGDCAAALLAEEVGFVRPEGAILDLGHACDLHDTIATPQATSVLVAPLDAEVYRALGTLAERNPRMPTVRYVAAGDDVREVVPGPPPTIDEVKDVFAALESGPAPAPPAWSAPTPSLEEMALRLVCAWTTSSPATADEVTVLLAVTVARDIQRLCGG